MGSEMCIRDRVRMEAIGDSTANEGILNDKGRRSEKNPIGEIRLKDTVMNEQKDTRTTKLERTAAKDEYQERSQENAKDTRTFGEERTAQEHNHEGRTRGEDTREGKGPEEKHIKIPREDPYIDDHEVWTEEMEERREGDDSGGIKVNKIGFIFTRKVLAGS